MKKGELKALRKAIRIWMARSFGIDNDEDCPLCDYHSPGTRDIPDCTKCCVAINAFTSGEINPHGLGIGRFTTCIGTPYTAHAQARSDARHEGKRRGNLVGLPTRSYINTHPKVKEAARAETEYLVSLLPPENREQWDMKKLKED